jgi:hypothetical protein
VVVEECAEILEPHLITTLSEATQALLQIGDDKQLRPKVNVYELEKRKVGLCSNRFMLLTAVALRTDELDVCVFAQNFAVSLFERLAMLGVPCTQLHMQRRMQPDISRLTKHVYPLAIRDHPQTMRYPAVQGMAASLCFMRFVTRCAVSAHK